MDVVNSFLIKINGDIVRSIDLLRHRGTGYTSNVLDVHTVLCEIYQIVWGPSLIHTVISIAGIEWYFKRNSLLKTSTQNPKSTKIDSINKIRSYII